MTSAAAPAFEPRAVCGRCRRPESVCYCRHLTSIDTATRIVLLQHPRERDVAIGTARMASLCLPNSELHVGVHWRGSNELARALSDPARPAALLYPGAGAIDVMRSKPRGPITLVVVDGTWWQTKKVVRENPELARLPRYAFTPPSPSEYRIRKEPDAAYVSTIEALAHVLGVLEGDPLAFHALLAPFRAMIDAQIECEKRLRGARVRHARSAKPRAEPRPPSILRERAGDLVCVTGEANAWPYRCAERDASYPDELVHWVARRLRTGETFDFVVAPKHPLAPRTTEHIGLSPEQLAAGGTLDDLHARWRAFLREADVLCSWGRYATALFAEGGGVLPAARVDLRQVARVVARGKVGTLEEFHARLGAGASTSASDVKGRGGRRLDEVSAIARSFAAG
jgi:DTW domain-containing protein YfiP